MKSINFFKFHKIFLALSAVLILATFGLMFARGFNYGTDFRGGVEATILLDSGSPSSEDIRAQLAEQGLSTDVQQILTQEKTYLIRFAVLEEEETWAAYNENIAETSTDETEEVNEPPALLLDPQAANNPSEVDVIDPVASLTSGDASGEPLTAVGRLRLALVDIFGDDFTILQSRLVGSVLSSENRTNAFLTSFVVLLLIVGYLTMRFKLPFALAAISAVIYDVLIILGFVAFLEFELTILTIVAILTTFGYSVNDTIVLLDRVREEEKVYKGENYRGLINFSVNRVIGRTIITSITTLVVVLSLYLSTTGDYKTFALTMIIGLISGTYSSIYIAPAFLFFWNKYVRQLYPIVAKVK